MRFKDLINFIKLDTFSGTVLSIETMTNYIDGDPEREIVSLDLTISSDADPTDTFLYKMGVLEFMHCIKDHSISVGDHLTIRKYPFQTIYCVKEHVQRYQMDGLEKGAVRYLLEAGANELAYKAKQLRYERGDNDLTVRQLENHSLRAFVLKNKLG